MKLTTDIFSEFDQVWALVTAGTHNDDQLGRTGHPLGQAGCHSLYKDIQIYPRIRRCQ